MEYREDPWCLTLSEDMMDSRDFKAEEVFQLDYSIELPKSFSLGERVYKTNYQNWWGSCTSNATAHWVQVLKVKEKGIKPVDTNLITPMWKDLWKNMGHNLDDKNDSGDYVEKAINTALKFWIKTEEGGIVNFDGYCYESREETDEAIDKMKRYLYQGCPIAWCLRGNQTTWNELSKGQLKSVIAAKDRTGGHAICLVGWDEWWFWFLNSWKTNDGINHKSRFYVPYLFLKKANWMFNWRYRPLFLQEQVPTDPAYLKRKNTYVEVLRWLKKTYPEETPEIQKAIENLSQLVRRDYPEVNEDLPL